MDEMRNYVTILVSELEITKYPFPKGQLVISKIYQLKNKKKSITSIKSFPSFHKHSFQIPSNLIIYLLIQTTLSSTCTHNTLKFFQIHFLKSTPQLNKALKLEKLVL